MAALYKMARVKKLWNSGGSQEMAVMICIMAKKFNNKNSGEFCADS